MKLLITACCFLITTCSAFAQNLELTVKMPDLPDSAVVYLYNMSTSKRDSSYVKDHSFSISTPLKSGSSFILQVGEGDAALSGLGISIYLEPGQMNISGKGGGFKRAVYSGDDFAQRWQTFLPVASKFQMRIKELEASELELTFAKQAGDELLIQLIADFTAEINEELIQLGRDWLDRNLNSGISAFLIESYLGDLMTREEKISYLKRFTGKAKDSEITQQLLKSLNIQTHPN